MVLIETHLFPNDASDAALPPASTCRLFHCRCCLSPVGLCSRCDRGNIYCSPCAPVRMEERIKSARRSYRRTVEGELVRAAAEKRRRKRRLTPPVENAVGDRGSLPSDPQGNTSASEHVCSASHGS